MFSEFSREIRRSSLPEYQRMDCAAFQLQPWLALHDRVTQCYHREAETTGFEWQFLMLGNCHRQNRCDQCYVETERHLRKLRKVMISRAGVGQFVRIFRADDERAIWPNLLDPRVSCDVVCMAVRIENGRRC